MSIVISMFPTMIKNKYLITLEKNIKHINKKKYLNGFIWNNS